MATGPANFTDTDAQTRLLTDTTGHFTIAGSDTAMSTIFTCGFARAVRAGAAGTIAIKRKQDTAFHPYPVNQGDYIYGIITSVGGTGSGSTAIAVCVEV